MQGFVNSAVPILNISKIKNNFKAEYYVVLYNIKKVRYIRSIKNTLENFF